jgi:type I restriction enzyme, S subunit
MGLNYFKTGINKISVSENLAFSYPFHRDFQEIELQLLNCSSRVSDFCTILSGFAFSSKDYENEGVKLLRIGDIQKDGTINFDDMNYLPSSFEQSHERFLIKEKDIVIAMTGATIGKSGYINIYEQVLLNQRVGLLRCKESINPKFIYYITKTKFFQNQIRMQSMGKSQPNISPFDILKIKIPQWDTNLEEVIIKKIELVESEIAQIKAQIQQPLALINAVFADYYGYDKTLWQTFGKGMTAGTQKSDSKSLAFYKVNINAVSNSTILRFSSRFHAPITRQLVEILDNNKSIPLNSILNEIVKGIQPKYTDEGEIPVAKIATLKNGYIDFSEPEFISRAFYNNLQENVKLIAGDVLICCTGKVSLGKIDFYDLEQESVLTVDSYILRVDETKYNPLFLTYFFRSILGAFQIERDYTGTTNQIHLYANEIANFQIPDLLLEEQEKIVTRVKKQLDAQKEIEKLIEDKQNAISSLILEAIEK